MDSFIVTLNDVMFGLLVRLPNGFEEEIFVFCIFGSLFLQQHASSNKGWLASPFKQSFRLLQLWPAGRLSFCNFSNSGPSFLHHPRGREYYNEQDLEYYSPTEQKYNLLPIDWFSWDPPLEMLATAFFISPKNIQDYPRLERLDKGQYFCGLTNNGRAN